MVLRNAALLITNDNGQGIMETIIVLLALLSQILGLFKGDKTKCDKLSYSA